jgi:hypothetical protein
VPNGGIRHAARRAGVEHGQARTEDAAVGPGEQHGDGTAATPGGMRLTSLLPAGQIHSYFTYPQTLDGNWADSQTATLT